MTEPDELYTLRAQFWLGHYGLCVTEGKSIGRRPMTPQLKAEREEFVTRAMLAMEEYEKVISQGDVPDVSPAMKALSLHAKYLSATDEVAKEAIVNELLVMAHSHQVPALQLTASHVFMAAGKTREALQCVNLGTTMEHLSACVQIYMKIDRLDLAAESLSLMKQADEDAILTQLSSVQINIATGRSTAKDAIHTLMGLTEQYGPNSYLLNLNAVANIVAAKYEAAESALQTAITEFPDDKSANTLINLIVCRQHMGKGVDQSILTQLTTEYPNHTFVQGLQRVQGALERESAKYRVTA